MLGMEEACLNIIKGIYSKPLATIMLNGVKLKANPAKIRNKVRVSTLSTFPKYITWSLGAIEWEGNKMDTNRSQSISFEDNRILYMSLRNIHTHKNKTWVYKYIEQVSRYKINS